MVTKTEQARASNKRYREKLGDEEFLARRAKMNKDWIAKNRESYNASKSYYRFHLKVEAIRLYSEGSMSCAICGYNADVDALTLDHIENDGNEHRKELGCGGRGMSSGTTMYERIKALGKLPGLQVLCANCNTIKAIHHKRKTTSVDLLAMPKPRWRK